MMQQYREAKGAIPGMLLLFRMGDFYELFDDDAEVASRVLGLTLTSRDKVIPMAGFRHQALETYLRKLLHAGHRVAVCDQVEDPAQAKGLVKREVTRVVTPGTLTEDDLLDPRQSNHLVALAPARRPSGAGRRRLGRPVHRPVPGRRRAARHGSPTSWAGWLPPSACVPRRRGRRPRRSRCWTACASCCRACP